jgi:hypothetical protein
MLPDFALITQAARNSRHATVSDGTPRNYLPPIGFGDFTLEIFAFLEQGDDGTWSILGLSMDSWKPYIMSAEQIPETLSIRCVKD